MPSKFIRVLAAIMLVLGPLLVLGAAPADAVTIPSDPSASGYIGLCGVDGKPMHGGNINDKPFIWTALSSVQPPAAYRGAGQRATLYIYQPYPPLPSDQWSGDTLTATSVYSTAKVPTAQATRLDLSAKDVLTEFQTVSHGLFELRMYFSAPGAGTYNSTYPATWIQFTGDTWQVVKGGDLDCGSGKAVSGEVPAIGSSSAGGTPTAHAPQGGRSGFGTGSAPAGYTASGSVASSSAGGGSSGSSGATGADSPDGSTTADAAETAQHGSGSGWVIAVVIIVVVAAAVGGYGLSRRRRAGHS